MGTSWLGAGRRVIQTAFLFFSSKAMDENIFIKEQGKLSPLLEERDRGVVCNLLYDNELWALCQTISPKGGNTIRLKGKSIMLIRMNKFKMLQTAKREPRHWDEASHLFSTYLLIKILQACGRGKYLKGLYQLA